MEAAKPTHADSPALAAMLVVSAFLVAFGTLHYGVFTKNLLLDTPLYERYGDAIVHGGQIPYRNFALEYPPAALVVFALPSLIAAKGDFPLYARLFEVLMLLCGAVASALVAYVLTRQGASMRRLAAGTLLAGLAPLALGPVVLSRFDLWPAVLTVGALAALLAGRRTSSFVLLAFGVAAKIYPLVLAPIALAYVWRRNGRREALRCAGVFAAVLALWFLPFLALSPSGVWATFAGQASRPLQIESLGASFLLAAHQLFHLHLNEVSSHGSDNLSGPAASALAALQSVASLCFFAYLWTAFARGEASRERLIRYFAAAVCGFIALNKVLSPQYLIWLFALVPLVRGRRGAIAGGLFVAAMVLTQLWFPRDYINLVYGLDPRASWLVLARDLTMLALLVTLVWPAQRARRSGVALVLVPALVAAAAAGAAAAATSAAGNTHSGLLSETGSPGTCASPRGAPSISSGTVSYDAFAFTSPPGGSRCVSVTLTAAAHGQLFSASYRGAFVPLDPQENYLADAGVCTNVAGLDGRQLGYSFTLAPGSRFAIEVENCGAGSGVAPYLVDAYNGPAPPAVISSATATRIGVVARLSWHVSHAAPGTRFSVSIEENGAAVPASRQPIRARGSGAASYRFSDPTAPLIRPLRFWILAQSPRGRWALYGPVSAG